jgi:hypothetical protein
MQEAAQQPILIKRTISLAENASFRVINCLWPLLMKMPWVTSLAAQFRGSAPSLGAFAVKTV